MKLFNNESSTSAVRILILEDAGTKAELVGGPTLTHITGG